MRRWLFAALCAAQFFPCVAYAQQAQVVVKQGDVYVSGSKVLLQDVAVYLDVDPGLKSKLDGLYIKRAALPGNRVVVSREYIDNKVRREFPGIMVSGAESVNVWTSKSSVKRADIEKAARDYVLEKMPWKTEDVQIKVKEVTGDVAVTEGTVLLKATEDETQKYKGNVVVPVGIFIDGKQYRIEPVSMTVRVFAPVAVAAADIGKGDLPGPDYVTMERNDVTFLPDGVITDSSWFSGKAAKRAVQKGAVLTKEMFEFIPLFRRGSPVSVIVRVRAVSVETEGIAQADGRPYDLVKVKLANGKTVEGKVDGSGKVIIEK